MKKILASVTVLLALTGLMVGCNDSDEVKPTNEQSQETTKNNNVTHDKMDQQKENSDNKKTY